MIRKIKKKDYKAILRFPLWLIGLWIVFLLLLMGSAMIPQRAVEKNLRPASKFYQSADMFEEVVAGSGGTVVHHYADAVLLNILWNQESETPLRSALDSVYYQNEALTQGENLAETLNGREANTSYARYWHGSLILLKPLLCVLSFNKIKVLGGILLAILALSYLILLWKKGLKSVAISSLAAMILCRIWIVPMCFEYYPCFALMFLGAILVLLKGHCWDDKAEGLVFLTLGAVTCFFDFLTCEILTLGIPLLCLILVKNGAIKESFQRTVRGCAAWIIGYASTWLVKWGLSAAVLQRSLTEIALGQGVERLAGNVDIAVDFGFQPIAAILVNLGMVFPFSAFTRASAIWTVFGVLCFVLFCGWFLFRKEDWTRGPASMVGMLGMIPFVRYFVIHNHSIGHPFFTYRDLFLTIVSFSVFLMMTVSVRQTVKKNSQPKRQKGRRR